MHLVVDNVACLSEVYWIYHLVVSVFFIAIQVLSLASVAGIVEEQRVIRPGVLNEPMHCSQDILFRRLTHRVLLVVRQDHHVLSLITKVAVQISRHVLNIIDTSS